MKQNTITPGLDELAPSTHQKILNQEILSSLNKVLGADNLPAIHELDASDFSPQQVADRVLGVVRQALATAKNNGANQEQLNELYNQAKTGIEQGFQEAQDVLASLGALRSGVMENIHNTQALINEGLQKLADSLTPNTTSTPVFSQQSMVAEFTNTQSLSLQVETRDGDIVTFTLDEARGMRSETHNIITPTTAMESSEQLLYSSSNMMLSVDGHLDKGELHAIQKLAHKVDKLADRFFDGNVKQAFNKALKLDINTRELASYSINMEMSQTQMLTNTYQTISTLGDNSDTVQDDGSAGVLPATEFIAEMDDVLQLPDMEELFTDSKQLFGNLLGNTLQLNQKHHEKDDEGNGDNGLSPIALVNKLIRDLEELREHTSEEVETGEDDSDDNLPVAA